MRILTELVLVGVLLGVCLLCASVGVVGAW